MNGRRIRIVPKVEKGNLSLIHWSHGNRHSIETKQHLSEVKKKWWAERAKKRAEASEVSL